MNEYDYINARYKYLSLKRLENRLVALYNATYGDLEFKKYDLFVTNVYYKDVLTLINDQGLEYFIALDKAKEVYNQNFKQLDELKEIIKVSREFVTRFNSLFESKKEDILSNIISSEIKNIDSNQNKINKKMVQNYVYDYPISDDHLNQNLVYNYKENSLRNKIVYCMRQIKKMNNSFPLSELEILSSEEGMLKVKERIVNEIRKYQEENARLANEVEMKAPLDGKDV